MPRKSARIQKKWKREGFPDTPGFLLYVVKGEPRERSQVLLSMGELALWFCWNSAPPLPPPPPAIQGKGWQLTLGRGTGAGLSLHALNS